MWQSDDTIGELFRSFQQSDTEAKRSADSLLINLRQMREKLREISKLIDARIAILEPAVARMVEGTKLSQLDPSTPTSTVPARPDRTPGKHKLGKRGPYARPLDIIAAELEYKATINTDTYIARAKSLGFTVNRAAAQSALVKYVRNGLIVRTERGEYQMVNARASYANHEEAVHV